MSAETPILVPCVSKEGVYFLYYNRQELEKICRKMLAMQLEDTFIGRMKLEGVVGLKKTGRSLVVLLLNLALAAALFVSLPGAPGAAGAVMDKSALTEAQSKLSSDLLQLLDDQFLPPGTTGEEIRSQMQGQRQLRPADPLLRGIAGGSGDLVYVYISLIPPAATQVINAYAQEVTGRDEENHLAAAWVPVSNLEAIASLDGVRQIRTVLPPRVRIGSRTSEGDAIHRAVYMRAEYGVDGTGIKVGVISDGVNHRNLAIASGDLPAEVPGGLHVLSDTHGGDEGTAMLEIIHDLAPGAELYFHDLGVEETVIAFNSAIDDLVSAGADVIVDDVGWYGEPCFEDGTGTVAGHVSSVLSSQNIIYVSAAGNDAQAHYQGMYDNDGSSYHDFSGGTSPDKNLYVSVPNNKSVTVVLEWDDQFGHSGNDYDLHLVNDDTGVTLSSSDSWQNGDDDPLEYTTYSNTTGSPQVVAVYVYNCEGLADPKTLEVFILPDGASVFSDNIKPEDSIFGHPAVPGVIAVGAINNPSQTQIAYYSSWGPSTIVYPTPEQRQKPDILGLAGVQVTGAGGFQNPFYGTSAAAPHVAAIAALAWSKYPSYNAAQIRSLLLNGAVDLGDTMPNYVYGYGRADALGIPTSNANLSNLIVDQGTLTPAFTSGTTSYTVSVGNSVSSLTVTPTAAESHAVIKVNNTVVPSGNASDPISLDVGDDNVVTILVTAESGATRTYTITVDRASGGGGGGGGGGGSGPKAVTSTTGEANVNPAAGGIIGLGSGASVMASVTIPAGALSGTAEVRVTVQEATAPPTIPSSLKAAGSIFEFTVGGQASYKFTKPVTLTLAYDPLSLAAGEQPAIYYYDATSGQWVKLGGTVYASSSIIKATVDHFTSFVVLAEKVEKKEIEPVLRPPEEVVGVSDIAGHWAEATIRELIDKGVIAGYPDGTFRPESTITRAEFATIVVKALGLTLDQNPSLAFSDASSIPVWASVYIAAAHREGIIGGYTDGSFGPGRNITRAEMAVMAARALGVKSTAGARLEFADASAIPAWAAGSIAYTVERGIFSGYPDNTFRQANRATRAEACAIILKMMQQPR